jgi:acetyl-CoA acetyltransferase
MSLHTEAAFGAIADAGLRNSDIDGIVAAYSIVEPQVMMASGFLEYSGLQPEVAMTISNGGCTGAMMVMQAAMLVEQGHCRHALVVAGDNRLSGLRGRATSAIAAIGSHPQFEFPYGLTTPGAYALVASRYMHEYGIAQEQLAAIPVTQRKHAGMHPLAHHRAPISIEDVLKSRFIATPMRLLDCCPNSDGGAALVVSAHDAAADLPDGRVAILGSGQGHTHEFIIGAPSLTHFGSTKSAHHAFGRAGVSPADIDIAEIYDSFTITVAVELESMGFFEKGEAGPAAAAGDLAIGGRLPCNTHGGLLSYGHSGAAGGLFHFVEAVEQLRGRCGGRQVNEAQLAMVHGSGGILAAHCSIVLGLPALLGRLRGGEAHLPALHDVRPAAVLSALNLCPLWVGVADVARVCRHWRDLRHYEYLRCGPCSVSRRGAICSGVDRDG